MIATCVKRHLHGDFDRNDHYTKPYTKKIDALEMLMGYKPPNTSVKNLICHLVTDAVFIKSRPKIYIKNEKEC